MIASLTDNLETVRQTITRSAERAGRDPGEITIVAVTKTFPVARIREAVGLGLRLFGENRVQEAIAKIDEIGTTEASWHLIGHLQSNKAKFIGGRFSMVQSLDSVGIVGALGRRLLKPIDVLVEVNVGEEAQKTGALPADLPAIVTAIESQPKLRLQGLMTIVPMTPDPDQARPFFRRLRVLRDETAQRLSRPLPILSMGMTDDYTVAVEEGATMLRLGRALFGPR